MDAIEWLKANNAYYKDIVINYESLQQLPEDDVPSSLQIIEDNSDTDQGDEDNNNPDESDNSQEAAGDEDAELPRSFLKKFTRSKIRILLGQLNYMGI